MKRIIHLEATPEPRAYHDVSATGEAFFAIHTSLEVQKNGVGNESEDAAKEEFKKYHAKLETQKILLLKIKSGSSGHEVESVLPCNLVASPSTGEVPNLIEWLDERNVGLQNLRTRIDNYQTHDFNFYLTDKNDEIRPNDATLAHQTTASDLLRSSLNWTAPIPQSLGLLKLIKVAESNWGDSHVFVPYEDDGEPIPEPTNFVVTEQMFESKRIGFDIAYKYTKFNDVVCRSVLATDYQSLETSSSSIFADDGNIQFSVEADALFRLVTAIEESAASRLWTYIPMAEFHWSREQSNEQKPSVDAPQQYQSELKWLVENSLLALADPLYLVLRRPKSAPLFQMRIINLISESVAFASRQQGGSEAELLEGDIETAANKLLDLYHNNVNWSPKYLWSLFKKLSNLDYEERLPNLSQFFEDGKLITDASSSDYAAELADIALIVEDEAGLEAIIKELLKEALGEGGNKLSIELSPDGKHNDSVLKGWQAFQTFMDNEWNAAEAIRRDVGRLFSQALVNHSQPVTADLIGENLREADWFYRRAIPTVTPDDALLDLRRSLPPFVPPDLPFKATFISFLETHLQGSFNKACDAITIDPTHANSFRPDPAPQPLPIQISAMLNTEQVDRINSSITGFGVIIQVSDFDTLENAAHASIVSLAKSVNQSAVVYSKTSILPALPTINDGSTELFITYRGLPLNSAGLVDSSKGGPIMDDIQRAERDASIPPFVALDAGFSADENLQAPPPLAYGYKYSARAFWVANSGVLPIFVRDDDDQFTPKNPEYVSGNDVTYLRRTAISELTIIENSPKTRIGTLSKGVFPLAADYPRLSLSCIGNNSAILDIFRRSDGGGRLWNSAGEKIKSVKLYDFVSTSETELVVDAWTVDGRFAQNLNSQMVDNTLIVDLTAINEEEFWLRLTLSTAGTVSFADPTDEDMEIRRVDNAPILLVAPENSSDWKGEYTQSVSGFLTLPGVSFPDFECWASNPKLMKRLSKFGDADNQQNTHYLGMLREAQAQFGHFDETYADAINKLPDPAVEQLLVTLEVSDNMKFGEELRAIEKIIEINPYEIKPDLIKESVDSTYSDFKNLIDAIILGAQINFNIVGADFELKIDNGRISVCVPGGMVALLKFEPMVSEDFFVAGQLAMAEELKTYLGSRTYSSGGKKWNVFPGTSMKIEGLSSLEAEEDPSDNSLYLHPDSLSSLRTKTQDTVRGYRLKLETKDDTVTNFRQFGEADVITQCWRPSGRPIYRWIDPTDFYPDIDNNLHLSPAVEIVALNKNDRTTQMAINNFEEDAFFDRVPDDAEFSRVRLVPSPESTLLGNFIWPAPSATYYRHRIIFRSRYAPLMQNALHEASSSKGNSWSSRIAILANIDGVDITRPQVRTFMPMLQRVNQNEVVDSPPPLICILSEKPFEQLGLADRIIAAIETVHDYRFTESEMGKKLSVNALRKEVGPDPRLTYFGVQNEGSRQFILHTEGPVGLHFDSATTATPAFSNSQFLLHFKIPNYCEELEECFSGVSMTRIVEPSWIWSGSEMRERSVTPNSLAWWLELDSIIGKSKSLEFSDGNDGSEAIDYFNLFADDMKIVTLELTEKEVSIKIAKEALYPSSGAGFVTLCTTAREHSSLFLLHRRLNDSLYSLSLLSRPPFVSSADQSDRSINEGILDQVQLIVSVEYHATGKFNFRDAEGNLLEPSLLQVAASNPTFVEWVRTNRNLSEFHTPNGKKLVSKLSAKMIKSEDKCRVEFFDITDEEKTPLRLRSPVSTRNYPLNVRRHLALIVRHKSTDLGREIGLYNQATLLTGRSGEIVDSISEFDFDYSVAIAEFETRAEVLLNANSITLNTQKFKRAKFDLISTKPERQKNKLENGLQQLLRQLRFNIRVPHGTFDGGQVNYVLFVDPIIKGGNSAPNRLEMSGIAPNKANELTILLTITDGGDLVWQMIFESDDDTWEQDPQNVNADHVPDFRHAKTINMEMSRSPSDEDLWTDVTLLHTDKSYVAEKHPHSIDFDWFFNEAIVEDDVAAAVSPARLNRLPEVQARLIGLSEPIKVISL